MPKQTIPANAIALPSLDWLTDLHALLASPPAEIDHFGLWEFQGNDDHADFEYGFGNAKEAETYGRQTKQTYRRLEPVTAILMSRRYHWFFIGQRH